MMQARYRKKEFLADAELSESIKDMSLLKVGHHGSFTASGEDFIKAMKPVAGILSYGENNRYGHPHKETMKKYHTLKLDIYTTAENGTITVTSDGKDYHISAEQGEKQ